MTIEELTAGRSAEVIAAILADKLEAELDGREKAVDRIVKLVERTFSFFSQKERQALAKPL